MSRHNDILAAIKDRLKSIAESAGYSCNAGDTVYLGLEYETAPPVLPCLAYFVGETVDGAGSIEPSQGEENHLLNIEINGFIADNERAEAADLLRQDILRALRSDQYFGGLTDGFEGTITSVHKSEPRTDGEKEQEGFLGQCMVSVTILYVTLYGES